MAPTLIVLTLLAIAAIIVAWAVRRKPSPPPTLLVDELDTAWNDPVTPSASRPAPAENAANPPGEFRP